MKELLTAENLKNALAIVQLLSEGKTRQQAADMLDLPLGVINMTIYHLRHKYDAIDIAHLVAILIRKKLIR